MTHLENFKKTNQPDLFVRLSHWGFILFGVLAFLTGELAGDFKSEAPYGYFIHSFFGITLSLIFSLYVIHFFFGKSRRQHLRWFVIDKKRMVAIKTDFRDILKFKLPTPEKHGGLAEVVQLIGLVGILVMSITGVGIFFMLRMRNYDITSLASIISFHEMIKVIVLIYLLIHVSAAIMHTLAGHRVLGNIFSLKRK